MDWVHPSHTIIRECQAIDTNMVLGQTTEVGLGHIWPHLNECWHIIISMAKMGMPASEHIYVYIYIYIYVCIYIYIYTHTQ